MAAGAAQAAGKYRQEGKNYVVADGDVSLPALNDMLPIRYHIHRTIWCGYHIR